MTFEKLEILFPKSIETSDTRMNFGVPNVKSNESRLALRREIDLLQSWSEVRVIPLRLCRKCSLFQSSFDRFRPTANYIVSRATKIQESSNSIEPRTVSLGLLKQLSLSTPIPCFKDSLLTPERGWWRCANYSRSRTSTYHPNATLSLDPLSSLGWNGCATRFDMAIIA